ncbi:MAG: hypothetical protein WEE89_02960 [Gemmatimonadota bacterium]
MSHRIALLIFSLLLPGCTLFGRGTSLDVPEDEARHRAALTALSVQNRTSHNLTIAFRVGTPPVQEVVLGTIAAGRLEKVAPVPAGEPIVLVARTPDGRELRLAPRSYPIDGDWTWEIPATAQFRAP